jgi:hypothetical protein
MTLDWKMWIDSPCSPLFAYQQVSSYDTNPKTQNVLLIKFPTHGTTIPYFMIPQKQFPNLDPQTWDLSGM